MGSTPATTEAWTAAVEFSDSYTKLLQIFARLKTLALRDGMSEAQWSALVRGDSEYTPPP